MDQEEEATLREPMNLVIRCLSAHRLTYTYIHIYLYIYECNIYFWQPLLALVIEDTSGEVEKYYKLSRICLLC